MKEIPGFDGYFVTEDGEVWSKKRGALKKLGLGTEKYGYQSVSMQIAPNVQYQTSAHRCVALAYIPNPNNLPDVCHKDDNPKNNHHTNLFWGTHTDNMRDKMNKRRAVGLVLTEAQVLEIRSKPFVHGMFAKYAREWGVPIKRLRYAYHGKTYKHVK